jgi:5-methylcytosine-specific restriction endonuclease McrA
VTDFQGNQHRLWAADPHQFGPGKVHIVDTQDSSKTLCGRPLASMPGSTRATKATCKTCCEAAVRRPEQERRRQEYERQRVERERLRVEENARWQSWYADYLRSPQWRAIRQKVLRRANGACEGCGDAVATQVHHITYKNVGNEFLWELRAICDDCHDRCHDSGGN